MSDQKKHKFYYRRSLPHFQPEHATLFVTFRLAGSIPRHVLRQWREEYEQAQKRMDHLSQAEQKVELYREQRKYFGQYDAYLDAKSNNNPKWLANPTIAQMVGDSIHFLEAKQRYRLDAFCLMSNHGHIVFSPLQKPDEGTVYALREIMHSLKSYTAHQANVILERQGAFWQRESYDHVIRDEQEWWRILRYVVNNPVKAGLVEHWKQWKWTYCKYDLE